MKFLLIFLIFFILVCNRNILWWNLEEKLIFLKNLSAIEIQKWIIFIENVSLRKIIVFLNGRNGTRVKNFNLKVKIFLIWLNSHFYENFSSRNIEKKIELIRKKVSFCFTLKQYHIKNRTFIPFVKEFSRFSQFSSQNFILIFSYTVSSLIDEALIKRLLRLNSNNRLMNFTVDYDNSKGGFPIFKFFPLVFKNFNSFYKNQWEKWFKSSFIHFN